MRIEKYNQKLLAIIGTLILISLVISIFMIIELAISDFFRQKNYEEGILSNEKVEKLQKKNKRKQVISYESPQLIDTLNTIYIVPVSYANLEKIEDIETLNLLSSKNDDSRYARNYYGRFNNVIIYRPTTNKVKKIFNDRINFNEINIEYFPNDIFLIFKVADADTNNDGVINLQDYKSIYIYSLSEKKLDKISVENADAHSYKFINNSKNLIIRFGIDKNKNGSFEASNEPIIIRQYNYQTKKLIDFIGKNINDIMQKTLEGSIK